VYADGVKLEIGKSYVVREGSDVTIAACGTLVDQAMRAAEVLAEQGISARVINIATIKPIDREIIIKAAKETGAIVTAEEHNIIGGLGSAVAEVLCEECPVPMLRVGTNDEFGRSGVPAVLLEMYGLDTKTIVEKAKIAISKKL
jgi:transketolase